MAGSNSTPVGSHYRGRKQPGDQCLLLHHSGAVANSTTPLAAGKPFTIQVGSQAATTITIDSTNNTLDGLAAAVTNANIGVTASWSTTPTAPAWQSSATIPAQPAI